ncbi:MAG: respiratory nitrate reductase subunit gamma [Cryobacterium sp.]|nr:respiratory nitrate reductase subunit gamma [Cryobacterium sp.]
MNNLDVLIWVAFPYAAAASFFIGHIIRYRYDQYGWTSRSSQTYENKWLRWGSPLFHYGMLAVIAGHIIGLLIPREWLDFIGIDDHIYHLGATWLGTAAAAITVIGMILLLIRRGAVKRVFKVTTTMDVVMYVFLFATIAFGTLAVVQFQVLGAGYDYRGSVSPWIRSLILMQPNVALMAGVPLAFQLHVITATALFAIWPFTRLIHVLSVPIWYLFRPYVVYRSRDKHLGARKPRPGWERSVRPGQNEWAEYPHKEKV